MASLTSHQLMGLRRRSWHRLMASPLILVTASSLFRIPETTKMKACQVLPELLPTVQTFQRPKVPLNPRSWSWSSYSKSWIPQMTRLKLHMTMWCRTSLITKIRFVLQEIPTWPMIPTWLNPRWYTKNNSSKTTRIIPDSWNGWRKTGPLGANSSGWSVTIA